MGLPFPKGGLGDPIAWAASRTDPGRFVLLLKDLVTAAAKVRILRPLGLFSITS
jgi:hypothetical protein